MVSLQYEFLCVSSSRSCPDWCAHNKGKSVWGASHLPQTLTEVVSYCHSQRLHHGKPRMRQGMLPPKNHPTFSGCILIRPAMPQKQEDASFTMTCGIHWWCIRWDAPFQYGVSWHETSDGSSGWLGMDSEDTGKAFHQCGCAHESPDWTSSGRSCHKKGRYDQLQRSATQARGAWLDLPSQCLCHAPRREEASQHHAPHQRHHSLSLLTDNIKPTVKLVLSKKKSFHFPRKNIVLCDKLFGGSLIPHTIRSFSRIKSSQNFSKTIRPCYSHIMYSVNTYPINTGTLTPTIILLIKYQASLSI